MCLVLSRPLNENMSSSNVDEVQYLINWWDKVNSSVFKTSQCKIRYITVQLIGSMTIWNTSGFARALQCSVQRVETIVDHTCVTAAGNFTVWPSVLPVILVESGIPSLRTGSARPYLVVNRILICSGRLGLPHQQGWGSCSGVLSTLFTGATVFATSTKH